MKNNFVHLHCHSHYSLLDGLASPSELAERVAELGQSAVAITDHGNMYGAIDFYTSCMERGIKPIIGYEGYVAPFSRYDKESKKGDITAHHITLLAKNSVGYHNLLFLSTRGYTEGFYYKPRIDMELIRLHHDGLVCLSGCMYSLFSRGVISRMFDDRGYVLLMQDIFGDDFYLECQDHGLTEQKIYKDFLLSQYKNQTVATNDVHYIKQNDAKAHEALLCIGTGTHIYDEKRMRFTSDQLYMKSREEMQELFPAVWLDKTQEISDKCGLEIKLHKTVHIHNPEYAYERLKEECDAIVIGMPEKYLERYKNELEAIRKTGYSEYLLVVSDFIKFALSSNIPIGSGRGSSAGSLVCFLLGITKIDPIQYGLLFERFINTERNEPPDIDVDVSQARRGEIIEYLKNEYGKDKVSQIVTFGSMKTKAAIKDVCRVLQLPFGLGDKICKLIPEPWEGAMKDVWLNDTICTQLIDTIGEEKTNQLFSIATKIEGRLRHSSTHAAGIVISSTPLIENMPLCTKNDTVLTQYDMYGVEKLGLLKFDVLGLRTLDVIYESSRYAGINHDNIPLDDHYVYSQIQRGETFGIFQYEGWGYTKFIKKMQPRNFDHLIALGALYRPGPMASGMADEYVRIMNLGENQHLSHLDGITDDTYGILLYQEQVMQATVKYAGFTLNEADILRKAMGKKDAYLMASVLSSLHDKLIKKGHKKEFADDLVNKINKFARYGWNKAHAVAYAMLSYKTAYLKFTYPTEFFCALLNSELDDGDRIREILVEATTYKVKIAPPRINISSVKFLLHSGIIYAGLLSIKGIGSKACGAIIEEREKNGEYMHADDLRRRIPPKKLNVTMLRILTESGVFDVT